MSENRNIKEKLIEEIEQKAKNAKSIIVADYKGLTVEQDTKLRNDLRQAGIEYKVYKNRLIKIALNNVGIKLDESKLEGQTAIAFSSDDLNAAKLLKSAEDDTKKLKIKCGYGFGKALSENDVKELASIPSKEVLIAQLLGMLTMPMRGLAVALDGIAKQKA